MLARPRPGPSYPADLPEPFEAARVAEVPVVKETGLLITGQLNIED